MNTSSIGSRYILESAASQDGLDPVSVLESTPQDSPTRVRSQVPEDRSNGELTVEDISGYDAGYDADIEVIWPHQYEEADSEPSDIYCNRSVLKQPDFDKLWQSGLIDSMNTLHCDSDKERRRTHRSQKKSRKRKSRDSFGDQRHLAISSHAQLEVVGLGNNGSEFNPKKLRRKSGHSGDGKDCNSWINDTLKRDGSSSTTTLSGEYSGKESISAPAQGDRMDID